MHGPPLLLCIHKDLLISGLLKWILDNKHILLLCYCYGNLYIATYIYIKLLIFYGYVYSLLVINHLLKMIKKNNNNDQ